MTAEPSRTLTDAERERLVSLIYPGRDWPAAGPTLAAVEAIVAERVAEARRVLNEALDAATQDAIMARGEARRVREAVTSDPVVLAAAKAAEPAVRDFDSPLGRVILSQQREVCEAVRTALDAASEGKR